jgi:hypothetical protein
VEWFKYRPAVVKGSPYYRRASAVARLAYLESVGDLWCAAVATGTPALPADAIDGCDELVASKLAVETRRGIEIPWVTDLWEHEHAYRDGQREHGKKPKKNTQMKGYPKGSLKHPKGASVCLSSLSSPERARVKPKSGRRAPEDWAPDDGCRKLAAAEGVDFDRALAQLRDHEFTKPHSDWNAVFRNWIRRSDGMTPRGGGRAIRAAAPDSGRTNTDCHTCGAVYWLDEGHTCPKEAAG